ncbi:MAG: hypothetical protein KC933_03490 [Myxococcales bacterium]|nr:hypothetical protein [Myxococcales bacterium]
MSIEPKAPPHPGARPKAPPQLPPHVLDPAGPVVVLGGADPFNPDIRPEPTSLFGPRRAFLAGPAGPLFVADTGHHRVVMHRVLPTTDRPAADLVLGQPDFQTEGRNARMDEPTAATMNVPTGICAFGEGIAVADSWNNRVLIWHRMPTESAQPADIILGQVDPGCQRPNRDLPGPRADTMHWPFQVLVHEGRLYVADAGNRRVLVWRTLPTETGQPADFALGQAELTSRDDNGGGPAGASSVRWPHDITVLDGDLAVSDAGNNRVLIWDGMPDDFNAPARAAVGQIDFTGTDHNQGGYWPNARALNMPYAAAASGKGLLVADTASSRLLAFSPPYSTNMAADRLTGQAHFGEKGDNKNRLPVRDSLCWPYGIQVVEDLAVVADTGNHRVVLWKLAP